MAKPTPKKFLKIPESPKQAEPEHGGGFLAYAIVTLFVVVAFVSFFWLGYFTGSQSASPVSLQPFGNAVQSGPAGNGSAKINIVSVTSKGEGAVNEGVVEIQSGAGRILFSLNPFVEPDTQDSVQIAAGVAEKFTGKSLVEKDVIYSVEHTNASLVGGPSAGAALAVATIAAIEGMQVRSDATITGSINADGIIGQIGGVIEKAVAAAENGMGLFIVPKGQKSFTYYEQRQQQTQKGRFTVIRTYYVPKTIDLQKYLDDQNFSMRVVEVSKIGEAAQLLLQ